MLLKTHATKVHLIFAPLLIYNGYRKSKKGFWKQFVSEIGGEKPDTGTTVRQTLA